METNDKRSDSAAALSKKTVNKFRQTLTALPEDLTTLPPEKIRQVFHELEVHQTELEMQNDELLLLQERLSASQKRYFDLYDLAPVGYCVINEKGLILKANLTASTLLGKTQSEMINTPLSLFILKKDQDILYLRQKLLFETFQPQAFEVQMHRTKNPPFWARLDISTDVYEGEINECQVTFSDISEDKQTEHDLKKRIKELNFFFSLSDLLTQSGISLYEILKTIVKMIPPAFQFPEITVACIEFEGQVIQTEHFCKTQWMQTRNILLRGKIVGKIWVSYLENRPGFGRTPFLEEESLLLTAIAQRIALIIDRIQMADKVRQSEQFLRKAINSITNPFFVINAVDYTIELANQEYGGDDVVGKKCYAVSHQLDTPCTGTDYPCPVREVKRTKKPFMGEKVFQDDQGNLSTVEMYAYPVSDRNKKIIQIIAYQIDVTMRRQTEMKLEHKAIELEEMNTALKVLLKRREQDKDDIEEKIFANFQLLLTPCIQNLEKMLTLKKQKDMMNILKTELKHILSPFSKQLSNKMINLTPTEIHVADLIKLGKTNKEISQILNCSPHTISRHRDNIRKKTGLKNKKINLRSFLLSLQ